MRRTLLGVLAALVALCSAALTSGPAVAADGLPTDPAASGYIGFCDETGHNVTGGDIDTVPFVWKAVASTAPPAQFQGLGENAVLNIYQPRPQVAPGEWSGRALTAASFYSSRAHPAVQATYDDESLADFTSDYPPLVNGLYVLRIYYGKANYGLYNRIYPTTTIQVVGKRWSVVSGGTVDCGAAKAVSNEQLTGVVTKRQFTARSTPPAGQTIIGAGGRAPAPLTRAPAAAAPAASRSSSTSAAGPGSSTPSTGARAVATSGRSAANGGSGWMWLVIVPAAVLVLLGGVLLARRRSAAAPQSGVTS